MEPTPAPPREAATVLFVRDFADALEVFLQRRHDDASFVPGAHVFPGGQVDAADAGPVPGADGFVPDPAVGALGAPDDRRFRVAALREAFEEAGVLVARRADGAAFRPGRAEAEVLRGSAPRVAAGAVGLADLLVDLRLELDLAALVPIGRWITPPVIPIRFDTWFFVAAAPEGQTFGHDGVELVASEWARPTDALARATDGEIDLVPPTRRALEIAGAFASGTDLLAAARSRWSRPDPILVGGDGLGWQLDLVGDGVRA